MLRKAVLSKSTTPKEPYSLREWLSNILLAAVVGVGGGLGAVVFRKLIEFFYSLFYLNLIPDLTINGFEVRLIIIPVLGGLIIGPLVYRIAIETKGHGVPELMEAVHVHRGIVRWRVLPVKLLVSSITIGSGGSAGREGPIAQIGGTIGSILAQIFKLDEERRKLLTCWGAGAGIAGTFNAPLGGAFFGLEVVMGRLRVRDLVPALVASTVAACVAAAILGTRPAFRTTLSDLQFDPSQLPIFATLGVIFGLLSFIWVKIFYFIEDFFDNAKIPNVFKPAIGLPIAGIFSAILVYHYTTTTGAKLEPMHFGVMGVGYNGMDLALMGELPILLIFLLAVLKIISTAFTIGSGGSGGIFAPSLYIGTMFGLFFGWIFCGFPSDISILLPFAVGGMGALFAGAARAPLTAIFQVPEMTRAFNLFPNVAVMCGLSYVVFSILYKGSSIYTLKIEKRGVRIKEREVTAVDILESVKVSDIMTPIERVVKISPNEKLTDVLKKIEATAGYPVVDNGRIVGIITYKDIKIALERDDIRVEEVMSRNLIVVYPDENLKIALTKLIENDVEVLPVVTRDDERKLLGILTRSDIMKTIAIHSG